MRKEPRAARRVPRPGAKEKPLSVFRIFPLLLVAAFAVGMWAPLPCAIVSGDAPPSCAVSAGMAGCPSGSGCGDQGPACTAATAGGCGSAGPAPAAASSGDGACGPGTADPGCSFCVCCPCWVTVLPAPVTIDLADGEELHAGGADEHYTSRTPRPAAPPPKAS